MNYKSELQRLQRLLRVDHNAYLDELDKPWSSMDEDLDLAIKILLKHASTSGGRLPLLEACYFPDDPSLTKSDYSLARLAASTLGRMRPANHAKRLALDAEAPLRINGTSREQSWKGAN
jgi:hypothetical protein